MTLDKKSIMALVLLALGLLVAVPQLIPDGGDTVIVDGELFEDDEPGAVVSPDAADAQASSGPSVDLIAAYGSWKPAGTVVADPFGAVEAEVEPEPEAPTEQVDTGPKPFPPAHLVSLVLLAGSVPRAVVDQRVVRQGDEIAAGRVLFVSAGAISVESELFGRLIYDLGIPGARGYGSVPPSAPVATDAAAPQGPSEDVQPEEAPDADALPGFPSLSDVPADADPAALAEAADRMLKELYANIGAPPEEDGR